MRDKVDYGIYFNSDFCQIARMEEGMPVIKKSDLMKDSMPLCVVINKRQDILVGDNAWNVYRADRLRSNSKSNSFVGFTRTLGTSHTYESLNASRSFTSEELLAECFKKLKSFISDEKVNSVVITVPDKFINPQNEAIIRAGKMAGFEQIELVQESFAASLGYGLGSKNQDSFWLMFDFGGGTFDVTLIKSEEGILTVKDSEGDNWLGGSNIKDAIIDEIIIPNIAENFAVQSILEDSDKKEILRNAVIFYAEEVKKQMSFKESHYIISDCGDLPFEDENGNELAINIEITQQDLAWVTRPIYQKAIDITIDLLKRNNLKGRDIDAICLVGVDTYFPILRRMLKEQITDTIDTSVDPMTVVAKGAALFASTISVSDEVKETSRDKTRLQLNIKYEATSVELDELISLKVLKDKSTGIFPEKIYADIVRSDGVWSSGKKLIGEKASIIEVFFVEGYSNSFEINTYDEVGNKIDCQPTKITIIQGIGGLDGVQVLPYHIGIAKHFAIEDKELFMPIKGLEKNKRLPAIGVINGFRTPFDIRPGFVNDIIRIPIYQGDYNAEGTDPLLNNHVIDIVISGESLPALLPANSDIDFTIKVDKSQLMTFSAYIPYLNYSEALQIEFKPCEPITLNYIDDFKGKLVLFYADNPAMGKERFRFLLGELIRIEKNKVGEDDKIKVIDLVKKELLRWK